MVEALNCSRLASRHHCAAIASTTTMVITLTVGVDSFCSLIEVYACMTCAYWHTVCFIGLDSFQVRCVRRRSGGPVVAFHLFLLFRIFDRFSKVFTVAWDYCVLYLLYCIEKTSSLPSKRKRKHDVSRLMECQASEASREAAEDFAVTRLCTCFSLFRFPQIHIIS